LGFHIFGPDRIELLRINPVISVQNFEVIHERFIVDISCECSLLITTCPINDFMVIIKAFKLYKYILLNEYFIFA